jgi:rhodanese-related sulfurtransferase
MIRRGLKKWVKGALGRKPAKSPSRNPEAVPLRPVPQIQNARPPSKDATAPAEPPEIEVEAEQVKAWQEAGRELLFVDVRERAEIEAGHVPRAWLMPMGVVESQGTQLPRDRTLVFYCAAGGRSYGAAQFLRQQGYQDAWSLIGGFGAWVAEFKAPVTPPRAAPLRVLTPVLLKSDAAAERGLQGEEKGLPGAIQALKAQGGGWTYDLRVADKLKVGHLVSDVPPSDFKTIGYVPKRQDPAE